MKRRRAGLSRRRPPARAALRHRYDAILGESPAILSVLSTVDRIVGSDLPVLITGESGTGKELIARAIHENSPRAGRTFVRENCAAIPESLLESELFGYRRGAFTGAREDKRGLFEAADRGCVFLDEIGEMSLGMQSKLMRVLQSGEIRPVGADDADHVDVRLISATNRDLRKMVVGEPVPRGPLLPVERDPDPHAAPSRAHRGRPDARRGLSPRRGGQDGLPAEDSSTPTRWRRSCDTGGPATSGSSRTRSSAPLRCRARSSGRRTCRRRSRRRLESRRVPRIPGRDELSLPFVKRSTRTSPRRHRRHGSSSSWIGVLLLLAIAGAGAYGTHELGWWGGPAKPAPPKVDEPRRAPAEARVGETSRTPDRATPRRVVAEAPASRATTPTRSPTAACPRDRARSPSPSSCKEFDDAIERGAFREAETVLAKVGGAADAERRLAAAMNAACDAHRRALRGDPLAVR